MKPLLMRILRAPETITVVLLVIALVTGASTSNRFLDAKFLLDKFSLAVPIGFAALAMTFVIITGQIDLSVASGALLTMVVSALAFTHGAPMPLVIVVALSTGGLLGLFNGLLITLLGLPSLVVTLGTLALYRGLAEGLIGEGTAKGFPAWFVGMDGVRIVGVPVPVWLLLGTALVAAFALHLTTFGRRVYAVGTSEPASRYSGVNTRLVTVCVYTISGLSMGVAALVQMSTIAVVDAKQLKGEELIAITAVVLGGTSIFGGRGTIFGTVLAIGLVVAVGSAMGINGVKVETRLAVMGTLLISSVLLTSLTAKLFAARRGAS